MQIWPPEWSKPRPKVWPRLQPPSQPKRRPQYPSSLQLSMINNNVKMNATACSSAGHDRYFLLILIWSIWIWKACWFLKLKQYWASAWIADHSEGQWSSWGEKNTWWSILTIDPDHEFIGKCMHPGCSSRPLAAEGHLPKTSSGQENAKWK